MPRPQQVVTMLNLPYGLRQLSKTTKIYSKVPKSTDNSSKTTVTYGKLNHRKLTLTLTLTQTLNLTLNP